jgi:UDP-GlcNAc:undecaprenyl-phosphate GlcNAc-1-phosphate transferase
LSLLFLAPAVAVLVTLAAVPLAVRLARQVGAIDEPDPRKVHTRPMPRLGGLSVYLGLVAGFIVVAVFEGLTPEYMGLLAGGTLIFGIGVLDDIRGLSPRLKLLGQVIAAAVVIPFGVDIPFITHPLKEGYLLHLGFWGIPLTIFWIVAVTNAVNLIDGLDGLAAGVGCIAAFTLATLAAMVGDHNGVLPALVLGAVLFAFLPHNFFPARVFLGDCGAMLIGFVLACGAVIGVAKTATAVTLMTPAIILGIPLFDTFFAVLRRYKNGRRIFRADREHLHHRLLAIGLTHRAAVLVVYGISAVLGLSAVILTRLTTTQAVLLLFVVAACLLILAKRFGVIGFRWRRRFFSAEEKAKGQGAGF